jgi:hypothetical protein
LAEKKDSALRAELAVPLVSADRADFVMQFVTSAPHAERLVVDVVTCVVA